LNTAAAAAAAAAVLAPSGTIDYYTGMHACTVPCININRFIVIIIIILLLLLLLFLVIQIITAGQIAVKCRPYTQTLNRHRLINTENSQKAKKAKNSLKYAKEKNESMSGE